MKPTAKRKGKKKRERRGRVRGCPRGAGCRKARQANFGSVRGGAGRGVSRELTAAARPARPIKRICSVRGEGRRGVSRGLGGAGTPASQFWQRVGHGGARGYPQCAGCRKRKGHGDAPRAPARQGWAGAAGAYKKSPARQSCGGSRGPVDPWSAAAASKRRDLWFFQS